MFVSYSDLYYTFWKEIWGKNLSQKFNWSVVTHDAASKHSAAIDAIFFPLNSEMNPPQPREIIELSPGKWKKNKNKTKQTKIWTNQKKKNRLTQREIIIVQSREI